MSTRREFLTRLAAAAAFGLALVPFSIPGMPWTGRMQGALESARRVVGEINGR